MEKKHWILIISASLIIVIVILIIYFLSNTNDYSKELNNMGYTTTREEEAFYKKIVTNNTLEDYYNDIANERESNYQEYYFVKESFDYIELKMSYQNNITKTLTITSNLKNLETTFNYEISTDNSYLLIDGNNTSDFYCSIINEKNISSDEIDYYCQEVKTELNSYLVNRDNLLENKQIKKIINK